MKIKSPIPLLLRDRTLEDEPFIFNSFLKSYKQNSDLKHTPNTIYYPRQTAIIKYLLENEKVVLAVFPEDPNELIGYCIYNIVSSALVIHYIYTKQMHRNYSFASDIIQSLLPFEGQNLIIATHITHNFNALKHKIPNAKIIFDPFYVNELRTR
jgi:hypothetical protein